MTSIVGVTGTHGAGKGTVVEYLIAKGFKHFSAREFLFKETDKRGLERNRENISNMANELRKQFGPEYVAFSLFKEAEMAGGSAVIESIYTVGEIEKIRTEAQSQGKTFCLIAIDADPKIRYERVVGRKSETDRISFEAFIEHEKRETTSNEPHKHNLVACRKLADIIVENNGTKQDLDRALDTKLSGLF